MSSSQPVNMTLVILLVVVLALFVLAWLAAAASVLAFIVNAWRYSRVRRRGDLSPQQVLGASRSIRLGTWSLLACAFTLLAYLLRQWAGTQYYDEIAQGLVVFSPIWWVVTPLTLVWWASVPVGAAGAIVAATSAMRLGRVTRR